MMKKNILFLLVGSMSIVSFVANANTVTVTNEYRKPIIIRFNGKDFKIGGSGGRQTVGFIQDMMSLDLKSETEKNFTSLANVVKQIKTEAASHPRARVAVIIPNTFSLTLTGWKPARIVWESGITITELAQAIQGIKLVGKLVQSQEDPNIIRQNGPKVVSDVLYNLKDFLKITGAMDEGKIPGIIANSRPPVHPGLKAAAMVTLQEALKKLQMLFISKGGTVAQFNAL